MLARCTKRTEKAIRASALPSFSGVGDEDLVGITRGACKVKGCSCNAFIMHHGRCTVMLQGKGAVRDDNNTQFLNCKRCGHSSVDHVHIDKHLKIGAYKPGRGDALPSEASGAASVATSHTGGAVGARGGLSSSYYYAATGSRSGGGGGGGSSRGEAHVGASGAVGAGAETQKDTWSGEGEGAAPDPFAAAGSAGASSVAPAAVDPFAAAAAAGGGAAESGGGGSLAECDPLAMPAAAARDQNMKDSEDW